MQDELNLRLTTHEAVCAERWRETIIRIKRIESLMIGACTAIIGLLATIAFKVT
jgi:hypothetical protein